MLRAQSNARTKSVQFIRSRLMLKPVRSAVPGYSRGTAHNPLIATTVRESGDNNVDNAQEEAGIFMGGEKYLKTIFL